MIVIHFVLAYIALNFLASTTTLAVACLKASKEERVLFGRVTVLAMIACLVVGVACAFGCEWLGVSEATVAAAAATSVALTTLAYFRRRAADRRLTASLAAVTADFKIDVARIIAETTDRMERTTRRVRDVVESSVKKS